MVLGDSRGALGWALLLSACSNDAAVAARTAVNAFSCAPNLVSVQELTDDRYLASGCGRHQVYQCMSGECQREGWLARKARERAAREFQCAAALIQVHWVQDETYRVDACGHSGTYECDDDNCVPEGSRPGTTVVVIPVGLR